MEIRAGLACPLKTFPFASAWPRKRVADPGMPHIHLFSGWQRDPFRSPRGDDRGQGDPGTKKKGRPQSVAVPSFLVPCCAKDLFRHRHAGKVSGDVAHQGRRSPSATFFGDTWPQAVKTKRTAHLRRPFAVQVGREYNRLVQTPHAGQGFGLQENLT